MKHNYYATMSSYRNLDTDSAKYDMGRSYSLLQRALYWSCVHLHSRHSADGGGKGKKGHNTSCLDWPTIHMRLKSLVLDPLSQWVLPELGPWTRHWREIQLWICRCHWGHWEAAVGRPASDWKNKFHLLCMYWLREAINGSYLKNFNTIPWCGDLVWF